MANIHEILGKRIQSLRKRAGLTQLELAEKANLSLKHLGEIERGRGNPTLESLHNLSVALDISLMKLFDLEVELLTTKVKEELAINIIQSASSKDKTRILKILTALTE